MASQSSTVGAGRGRGARTSVTVDRAVLAAAAHLTSRDRQLVRAVGEHRVLATGQLAALGFGSVITARHRLAELVRLGVLRRFRPHRDTGSAPWHYLLGPVGAVLLGAEDADEKRWLAAVRADRQLALERSQRLAHLVGVNWFFAALAARACIGLKPSPHHAENQMIVAAGGAGSGPSCGCG
jgi:Replication-relaxation